MKQQEQSSRQRNRCRHLPPHGSYFRAELGGLLVAILVAHPAATLVAQQRLPEWALASEPRLTIGTAGIELHRVRGGALLPDGRIAIADGGNRRIIVVSAEGELLTVLGRAGRGPREFEYLSSLAAFEDTLIAYDAPLARVSIWTADGSWVRSVALPRFDDQPVTVRAAVSPTSYVATSRNDFRNPEYGLAVNRLSLLLVDGAAGRVEVLRQIDWQRLFFHVRPNAATSYLTPFLGETVLVEHGGRAVLVPLDSASVHILDLAGSPHRRVALPGGPRPFDPELVDTHRERLLAETNESRFPGSGARIREVFGRDFPRPTHAPTIERAQAVGPHVWLRTFPLPRDTASLWYVLDPEAGALVGRIVLPLDWEVLGGDDRSVLLLRRDELDTEFVAIHDVRR